MYSDADREPISETPPRTRRRGARRLLLLQTTLRLIGERGIAAVNHRSVAKAAGVSPGTTTYWFESRQEMLREALEHFAQLEIENLRERLAGLLEAPPSASKLADELTEILMPQLGEQRWRTVAQYTLLHEAAREPELEPICREWTNAWIGVLGDLFGSLGVSDPDLEARMLLALLDGLLLNQLAAPDRDPEEAIRPILRAWFERLPVQTRSEPTGGGE